MSRVPGDCRSFVSGGPYDLIATVPDSSPGARRAVIEVTYTDFDVERQHRVPRHSPSLPTPTRAPRTSWRRQTPSLNRRSAPLAPLFGGIQVVTDPGFSNQCSLDLGWSAATEPLRRRSGLQRVPSTSTSRASSQDLRNQDRERRGRHRPTPMAAPSVAGPTLLRRSGRWTSVDASKRTNTDWNARECRTGPFTSGPGSTTPVDTGDATLILESPWSVAPTGGNLGPNVYLTGTYAEQHLRQRDHRQHDARQRLDTDLLVEVPDRGQLGQGRGGDLERWRVRAGAWCR